MRVHLLLYHRTDCILAWLLLLLLLRTPLLFCHSTYIYLPQLPLSSPPSLPSLCLSPSLSVSVSLSHCLTFSLFLLSAPLTSPPFLVPSQELCVCNCMADLVWWSRPRVRRPRRPQLRRRSRLTPQPTRETRLVHACVRVFVYLQSAAYFLPLLGFSCCGRICCLPPTPFVFS